MRAMSISGTRGGGPACMAATRACGTTLRLRTTLITDTCRHRLRLPALRAVQPVAGAVWPPINVGRTAQSNSCSPNFSFYQVGSRTQWNITKDFYMGVDVTYTHLNTAYKGANTNGSAVYPAVGTKVAATSVDDQNVWSRRSSGRRSISKPATRGQVLCSVSAELMKPDSV